MEVSTKAKRGNKKLSFDFHVKKRQKEGFG